LDLPPIRVCVPQFVRVHASVTSGVQQRSKILSIGTRAMVVHRAWSIDGRNIVRPLAHSGAQTVTQDESFPTTVDGMARQE
jgi:hypothetical protein